MLTDPDLTAPHLVEPRGLYAGRALAVVRPGSTREVAAVMAVCHAAGVPVVPQGGNTGLVGGQVPFEHGREIVLSLLRLDRVRSLDAPSNAMTVEAGVTLRRAQDEAERADRLFPLSLASEGTCTIGGTLATNAGGTAVLAYGNARDLVLGLEVVLADGRVLDDLKTLRKDNSGYALSQLFVGQEGTLGIVTAASLKLFPRPRARETAVVGVPDPAAALALLTLARDAATVTTFELIPRVGVDFVLAHTPARDPLPTPHPWYVLIEIVSAETRDLSAVLQGVLEEGAARAIVTDAALAASLAQRQAFWRIREDLSGVQGREGGSIKHDISVPVGSIPAFMAEAEAAVRARMPDVRIVSFGHVGDGNLHYNLSQPVGADREAFLARWREMNEVVHAVVARHHGSIAAEHGVGRLKRDLLPGVKDPVALDVMRTLKTALDPRRILNPGKVLD